jgi:hypothetical protein
MEYFEVITNAETGEETLRAYSPEEIAAIEKKVYETSAEEVLSQRNALLQSSDWTQLPDAPVDQTAWAFYRQSLRDITDQPGYPTEVIWPKAPE